MLKILFFSLELRNFPNITRIKSLYDWGRKRICLLAGEAISANLFTGEATKAHLMGALGQGVTLTEKKEI